MIDDWDNRLWCYNIIIRYDVAESGFQWCVDTARTKWEKEKTNEQLSPTQWSL